MKSVYSKSSENIFSSKSDVLKYLKPKLQYSYIESIFSFNISEWEENKNIILQNIKKKFNNRILIVRSSAIGEDSLLSSEAGNYESILNVSSNSTMKLSRAIKNVIQSYEEKNNFNKKNQILIQPQTQNISISGVIFTRYTNTGSPYYVINYDESNSTTRVTSGQSDKMIKIFRNYHPSNLPQNLKLLIKSVKEIENLIKSTLLDIEFGIHKNKVVIFQVRPITFVNNNLVNLDKKIEKELQKYQKQFQKFNKEKKLFGSYTIFSDMTDWNPAEIIGNNPHPFDYSLYAYLIMDKSWRIGREEIGYQKLPSVKLMKKFGNKPYVDIRASFNSFIPDKLNKHLKIKLMNFYLEKLKNNPHLHDKVEFEILFTCYDFKLQNRLKELTKFNFTKKEILEIKNSLIDFTNSVIKDFPQISQDCIRSINTMSSKRESLMQNVKDKSNYRDLLKTAELLLFDCINLGTVKFSTMARIAFIGAILLKSLISEANLSPNFYDSFMNSIETPVSKFQNDVIEFRNKKLSKTNFLKKYGHLRPGTYDILVPCYNENHLFLNEINFEKIKHLLPNPKTQNKISKIIKKYPLKFENIDFFNFVKTSLNQREELKFQFSHNLSDAIELIILAGKKLGFTREEMAYLDMKSIFGNYKTLDHKNLKSCWKQIIKNRKNQKIINDNILLPSLLFSKDDFVFVKSYLSKPNFITNKKTNSKLTLLSNSTKKIPDLKNKIVLIENADPGFDWIFTKNLSGLITKYGGMASHMAIRCAELGLPAAIGCGDLLFEKLISASKISLDCKNEQILILENYRNDQYLEEKTILKSLGYIK